MKVREISINSIPGVDLEPAALFVNKASSFRSSIWIEKEEKKANAKSLLGVLSLGLAKNIKVSIIAEGEDEDKAVEELAKLLE